jgi:hypothetical protein
MKHFKRRNRLQAITAKVGDLFTPAVAPTPAPVVEEIAAPPVLCRCEHERDRDHEAYAQAPGVTVFLACKASHCRCLRFTEMPVGGVRKHNSREQWLEDTYGKQ